MIQLFFVFIIPVRVATEPTDAHSVIGLAKVRPRRIAQTREEWLAEKGAQEPAVVLRAGGKR